MGADYLDKPAQWDRFVAIARAKGVIGYDSEFYGLDVSKQSCVKRAKIHVWSAAVRTGRMGPMGFGMCRGYCFPVVALQYPAIKALLEDKTIRKEVHNQSVDQHALKNHGITLRGARNTLGYVKWKRPGLINTPGRFKLKALMSSLLGREPICTFKQLVSDTRTVLISKMKPKKLKGCSCGVTGCKKRKADETSTHDKWVRVEQVEVVRQKQEKFLWPLEDITPEHPKWALLVEYAIEDSVAALQIAEVADDTKDPAPWPYGAAGRPEFAQPVELAIIKMEQVGFRRDLQFCTEQAAQAAEDEQKALNWLHRWYVVNSNHYGPHKRRAIVKVSEKTGKEKVVSGTDALWSSPAKRIVLFDELGFPRSPVWAKGRVKPGHHKLDHAAMAWIMKNHPPAKQIGEKLLLLGRIRSGLKYLTSLKNADDIVYITCGASDDDERSGAVTGRLAVKGAIAAQQLPKAGKKDVYHIRRAIIA